MQTLNSIVFGWYPYLCLTVFLFGSLVRFDREQYTWRTGSSQLLRRRQLVWGSNLFHVGILFIFLGHFVGLLTPIAVFDGFREALAANRAQFFLDVASGPFYGFNREGAKISDGVVRNWWRQGMMGAANAHYDGIKAFSETDQTDDLKAITVPTLVLQGDDDQIVPYKDASLLQAKLLPNATLKVYEGFPHGMLTTHADVINPDLLAFVRA